jgi:hypothetical protein
LKEWKNGLMEEWKNGIVEDWNNGKMRQFDNLIIRPPIAIGATIGRLE